jgi:comEA protein
MIYFTRQEQRIIIFLAVMMLLGIGLLLVKRFQPGWVMRLSMGDPDFDVLQDEVSPRLKSREPSQEQEPGVSDVDNAPALTGPPVQASQSGQDNGSSASAPAEQVAPKQESDQTDRNDEIDTTVKININSATREQLEALPRIGPVLAQRIIDYREKHNGFVHIDELRGVSGIGDATLQRIRDQIIVEESNGSD